MTKPSHSPRSTLVIELTTSIPVGTDLAGDNRVKKYLRILAEEVGLRSVREPETHLSPKYGLSGWLPCTTPEGKPAAIHLYAWDDRDPGFVSVDISTPEPLTDEVSRRAISFTEGYFVGKEVVHKTHREQGSWRELDSSIYRQRLSLAVQPRAHVSPAQAEKYLVELCRVLRMDQLSSPMIHAGERHHSAWEHWETSGTVAGWDADHFAIDIYTCKKFDERDAVAFTEREIGEIVSAQGF